MTGFSGWTISSDSGGSEEVVPAGDASRQQGVRLSDLLRASLEDLARTPAPNPPPQSVADRIDDERLKELTEARRYRRATVKFTLRAVGCLDTFATAFMIAYMASQWHHIEASVIIAYFTSVVVESIGILYVISKYLFPQAGPRRASDSAQDSN